MRFDRGWRLVGLDSLCAHETRVRTLPRLRYCPPELVRAVQSGTVRFHLTWVCCYIVFLSICLFI